MISYCKTFLVVIPITVTYIPSIYARDLFLCSFITFFKASYFTVILSIPVLSSLSKFPQISNFCEQEKRFS